MALPSWPSTLPKYFEAETIQITPRPEVLINRPQAGPSILRSISTVELYDVTGDVFLNNNQRNILNNFYRNILMKTGSFTWFHPYDETISAEMKFISPGAPRVQVRGSFVFFATLVLEMKIP